MPHTLSISTALFDGHPLEVAVEEIAAAGVREVEFAFIQGYIDFDEGSLTPEYGHALADMAAASGLRSTAVSAHMDLGAPEAVEMLERRVLFAQACGAGILITNSSLRPQRNRVLRTIDQVLTTCREHSVVLALENPGDGHDQLIGSAEDASVLFQDLDRSWVGFNYDFGNAHSYSDGRVRPEEDLTKARDILVHGHVKEIVRSSHGWSFAPVGNGDLPWREIFLRLDRVLPDLPISLEMPMRASRPDRHKHVVRAQPLALRDIRFALATSLDFIRSVTSIAP